MLFSSMTFMYLFLPIVCMLYFITKKSLHNPILLVASLIFYAWGEPRNLAVMLVTILINYFGAILIDKYPEKKKMTLFVSITGNLSLLFYFKYFNFLIDSINHILRSDFTMINVIMPIGISFYTFHAISYLIDVYRGEARVQKNIYKLLLYICLFTQLIAGPIIKYHDIEDQIDNRTETFDKVALGVKRFIIGLAKKMLIANVLGEVADKVFAQAPGTFSPLIAWIGAFAYTMQLYFDFSGYSDMAIGLGLIFGFKFMENFNYPYISKSITEFWRRWHISLSTWFKQYVYIPLGGNRISPARTYLNLLIVFLATGIWHGASWSFIIWGLWHGFFIVLEKATGWGKETSDKKINALKHIYAILVFVIGWVMFRSENMSYAISYIKTMFGLTKLQEQSYLLTYYLDRLEIITFIVAVLCAIGLFSNLLALKEENKWGRFAVNTWLMLLFLFSTVSVAASTYNPFIYFRF